MKVHHTRGVYPDGSHKDNAVRPKDLQGHIEYNLKYRPGRAFFVDGECLHEGNVSENLINKHKGIILKFNSYSDLYT